MEGKGRLFDRDDLDEEEKALFDQMVQEEMDKLENQFRAALPTSLERDDEKEGRNDVGYYQSKEMSESKSMDTHGRRVAPPPRISSSVVTSKENVSASTGHPYTQERTHTEKMEAQREYMRQLDQGVQQQREARQGGDDHHHPEDSYNGRGGNVTRHLKSRSEITTGFPIEEDRNGARIGNIGGSTSQGTPTSQKRAQQAAYAKSIADASSALEIGSGVARYSSRRQLQEDTSSKEDYGSHALSAIGQSSQHGKDNKKQQQLEYARQLQKQMQNNEENREKESQAEIYGNNHGRGYVGNGSYETSYPSSPHGYRSGNHHVRKDNGSSHPSPHTHEIGSVANFGVDPDTEASRKRLQQQKYAQQLQEQRQEDVVRKDGNDGRNVGGGGSMQRSRAVTAGGGGRDYTDDVHDYPSGRDSYGGRGIGSASDPVKSAAEQKRLQQKQYYDEITNAANAQAIVRERQPLRTASTSRLGGRRGSMGEREWENAQGTGLQIGNGVGNAGYPPGERSSSRMNTGDVERLDARAKKLYQQQMYAKQLAEDQSTQPIGTPMTENGRNERQVRRNTYDYPPSESNSPHYRQQSSGQGQGQGSGRGGGGGGGGGGGIFDAMSETEQAALKAAKKRASQQEYYRQLQEVEDAKLRGDGNNGYGNASRTSLYRIQQQQKEQEQNNLGAGTRYKGESPLTNRSRGNGGGGGGGGGGGNGFREGDAGGMPYYDDRGGMTTREPDPIDVASNAYKQRKQKEYYQALEHDAKSAPIANTYTAQRRPHHERDRELDERDYPYRTHTNGVREVGSAPGPGPGPAPGQGPGPGQGQGLEGSEYRREGYSDSLHQPGRDAYDGAQRDSYGGANGSTAMRNISTYDDVAPTRATYGSGAGGGGMPSSRIHVSSSPATHTSRQYLFGAGADGNGSTAVPAYGGYGGGGSGGGGGGYGYGGGGGNDGYGVSSPATQAVAAVDTPTSKRDYRGRGASSGGGSSSLSLRQDPYSR